MKQSTFAVVFLAVFLAGVVGQAAADLNSLRGAEAVPTTARAPELMEFINDKENIARTFEEQPPLVPHEVDKYTIDLKQNKCLECHMKQPGKDNAKSVEMSEAHFTDRNGKRLDHPSGARHFCNQCHVPQVDAQPLIGSNFQSLPR
mgnify:FL=1|jgi:cytochrome c-type protein NapB